MAEVFAGPMLSELTSTKEDHQGLHGTSYAPDTVTKEPNLSSPLTTQKSQAT